MTRAVLRPGRASRDSGASAVEFALVSPLLFILIFGMIAFGILFAQKLALTNGARQGARLAVVNHNTCASIFDQVKAAGGTIMMDPHSTPKNLHVEVLTQLGAATPASVCDMNGSSGGSPTYAKGSSASQPCQGSKADTQVIVYARWDGSLFVPLLMYDPTFPIEGKGVFRCEFNDA